jgi:hypothetical protein
LGRGGGGGKEDEKGDDDNDDYDMDDVTYVGKHVPALELGAFPARRFAIRSMKFIPFW